MKMGPTCPECHDIAGVSRLFWGLGKPFDCGSCGTSLIVRRGFASGLGIAGFLAFWLASRSLEGGELALVFVVILAALFLMSFMAMKPERASREPRR